MSRDWINDINEMHGHYGFHERVNALPPDKLKEMIGFRYRFLKEELNEMLSAIEENDAEGVVDALIDLCVVAIGTLDLYGVDSSLAWDEVHLANMSKEPGVKASRPNPLGLPDLIKPEGWRAPSHHTNHGLLDKALPAVQYTEVKVE